MAVVGGVGSGKSALLQVCLGHLWGGILKDGGKLTQRNPDSYCSKLMCPFSHNHGSGKLP